MRFPSIGLVEIPKPEHISVEDDLRLVEEQITKTTTEIADLEKKILSITNTSIEKEQLQRKLILLRIDLTEAQTKMAYLKEEELALSHGEAANEETIEEGMKAA